MKFNNRSFKPGRGYLFKIGIRNKSFLEKLSKTILKKTLSPYPNELFSSWIARNATANFMQTPTFVNNYFPQYKNKIFNRDTDILIDDNIAETFANRMSFKKELIFSTSLQSYKGYLSENIRIDIRNPLISTCKIRGTYPNLRGLKYCPLCLKEKEFFKKEWRLSFYTICTKHKCFLIDECPQCKEPISIIKRKREIDSFNCWNCGYFFKNSEIEFVHKESQSVNLLQNTIEILNKGYFRINNNYYYSIFYFQILRHISKLIYQHGYRNYALLKKECELHNILITDNKLLKSKFMEETISLKDAFVVFTASIKILTTIENFNSFIKSNNIPIYLLNRDMSYIPFWYKINIEKYYKQPYTPPFEEVKYAVQWMKRNNINPSLKSLSELFGVYLGKRKDIRCLIFS